MQNEHHGIDPKANMNTVYFSCFYSRTTPEECALSYAKKEKRKEKKRIKKKKLLVPGLKNRDWVGGAGSKTKYLTFNHQLGNSFPEILIFFCKIILF